MLEIITKNGKETIVYRGLSTTGMLLLHDAYKGKLTRKGQQFYRYGQPVPRRDSDEIRYTHLNPDCTPNAAGKMTLLRGKDTACMTWGLKDVWKSVLADYAREEQFAAFAAAQERRVA